MKFALDTPNGSEIPRAVRFSGWCLNEAGLPADALELRVDGVAVAQLERTPRWDLASAFPLLPEAVLGGFVGDLVEAQLQGRTVLGSQGPRFVAEPAQR